MNYEEEEKEKEKKKKEKEEEKEGGGYQRCVEKQSSTKSIILLPKL